MDLVNIYDDPDDVRTLESDDQDEIAGSIFPPQNSVASRDASPPMLTKSKTQGTVAFNEPSFRTVSQDLTKGMKTRMDKDLKLLAREKSKEIDMPASLSTLSPSSPLPEFPFGPAHTAASPDHVQKTRKRKKESRPHSLLAPQPSKKLVCEKDHSSVGTGVKTKAAEDVSVDANAFSTENTVEAEDKTDDCPSGLRVIHVIHCSGTPSDYHTSIAYADRPRRLNHMVIAGQSEFESEHEDTNLLHLNGTKPIYDLIPFLNKERGDDQEQLVVIRHIHCDQNELLLEGGQNLVSYDSVAIRSAPLRHVVTKMAQCGHVLRKNTSYKPNSVDEFFDKLAEFSINREAPFLFHHLTLLQRYADEHVNEESYVAPLIKYCAKTYGSDFREARDLLQAGFVTQKHLDKLFIPNTIAVQHKPASAFVVTSWLRSNLAFGTNSFDGWSWSPRRSGIGFERNPCNIKVGRTPDEKISIKSLRVYPLSFASEETKQMLEARGRKFCSLNKGAHISYTGYDGAHEHYYPESRFVIDYLTFRKMHKQSSRHAPYVPPSGWHPGGDSAKDFRPLHLDEGAEFTQDDFILMPESIHGFYLTEKQWIRLAVDNISTISWNKTAFDQLVLPSETKELIRALVAVRTSHKGVKHGVGLAGKRTDIISGKGNGLIMLLHGGPGTGKTLTAESVAEIAELPLYRVTCGDIGSSPEAVEKYLGLVTYLGTKWNCVLLLDEADVFLEERSMSDLTRNSLVSVFLRVLEYYDGILILTSNR